MTLKLKNQHGNAVNGKTHPEINSSRKRLKPQTPLLYQMGWMARDGFTEFHKKIECEDSK